MRSSDQDSSREQEVVHLLTSSYTDVIESPDFGSKHKRIKELFIKRDFVTVFQPENLSVYLVAYVPTRALIYRQFFSSEEYILKILQRPNLNVCCLGGGPGSELLGLASVSREQEKPFKMTMNVHDMADWSEAINPLLKKLESEWNIGPEVITYNNYVTDMLDSTNEKLYQDIKDADLVTLMFTVNELFKENKAKALSFLSSVREGMKKGAFLLIIDCAGEFSQIQVGPQKYMIYSLLDYVKGFKKILFENSRWYRFPPGITCPVKLDNQRYFWRLYRKD
eukprot:TRINITY_DN12952_c0_g1_i1.p1 TRINITY_DN12952_c0_g1~~TRINITY_DN12952_c0_g1_i1.p1  ORF type:complete len:280 (-),score=49.05 TRINITY_DN12952_c0_g1_i1:63-902(-)